jgi:mannose-1-phosphate guanylyltransferase
MIIPVILSGGNGTRLWPLSRKSQPKQFIKLVDEESLFCKTLKRFLNKENFSDIVTVCNKAYINFIKKEFKELNIQNGKILVEPVGRNTAPAITVASLFIEENYKKNDVVLILPSDHLIRETDKFIEYVKKGQKMAEEGYIITFSILPTKPETGYGYIKKGKKINNYAYNMETFVEKPDLATAWNFLKDGNYSWNSGIFMFKPSVMLKNIKEFEKDIYKNCEYSYKNCVKKDNTYLLNQEDFAKCTDISIDYAVMEKTKDKIAVIPMDISWSDLGNFESLYESEIDKDDKGNIVKGQALLEDVKDSYIRSETNDKIIAIAGLKDIAVIQTKDAILILNKEKAQAVRGIIQQLKTNNMKDLE